MVLGVLFDRSVECDAFYKCTKCEKKFFNQGGANHFESCSDYVATDKSSSKGRLGGLDNCILVFGPNDLHAQDEGVWARAKAEPGIVIS